MKQVHLHTESRQMWQDHQQEDLQPQNRFTYSLKEGKCHKTISKRTCNHETGSLTGWEWANATGPSARASKTMKQVHLHPESRQMPQDHQQEHPKPWNRFTYFLIAGKCHKSMSKRTCNHETGSLTGWEQANATRPSVRGPAAMKQVHLLAGSRQMPQDHEQEDLQPWNRFTYWLEAGKCHKTISKRTCSYETGSLTGWEQANATRPWARGPATMKQVHLLAGSRQMPQDHQQEHPKPWNRFTYFLIASKCHKSISKRTSNHETGSLTGWEQANATRPSVRGPAAMKQVHLLAGSRQMPQDHQQEDLQLWNRFTYWLGAGKCHKTISKRTCSYETGSLTSWEQANATRPSARGPATMKQVHLLAGSRQMPQDHHQQEDLQLWNRFTYILRADKCHKTINKWTCSHETGSLTYWEQANATRPSARASKTMKQVHLLAESRKMPQDHQQEPSKPWNRFTYWLRAGKCHKTISKNIQNHETGSLTCL